MKCLVGGYFGGRKAPHGGTQYIRTMLENPPDGVEYYITKETAGWLDTEYYGFLKRQKTLDAREIRYYAYLEKILRRLKWRAMELRKIRMNEGDADLIFYDQGFILPEKPYVSSIEGDFILTNRRENNPFREVNMETSLGRLYQKTVLKRILLKEQLRKILFWSDKARQESLKFFPEIEDKSFVLRPPINAPEVSKRPNDDKVRLLFVGGDWVRKGLLVLTEVYAKLKKRYDIELSVVTDESFRLAELGGSASVSYNLLYESVFPRMFMESDVFVLPSRFETFGYSLLEAMACALPVVSTPVYAIPEIVEDGKTGYLTPYGNMQALEEKLAELIEDASLRKKMGEAGRKKAVEKFGVREFTEKLGGVYEECVRK